MNPETFSLLEKLLVAALLWWGLPKVIPFGVTSACVVCERLRRLFSGPERAPLAAIRHEYGSPPLAPDFVSDQTLISFGFSLVETRRTDGARRVLRQLRSRNSKDPRISDLEIAVARKEYLLRRKKAGLAASEAR